MLKKVLIGFGVLAIVGALVLGGLVLANMQSRANSQSNSSRSKGGIYGTGPMVDPERTSIAEQMGISREELDERLASGEQITEIAASLGISETELQEIHTRAREETIQMLLEDGSITEEQAEQIRKQTGGK